MRLKLQYAVFSDVSNYLSPGSLEQHSSAENYNCYYKKIKIDEL
jgi:hypothetical protein